MKKPLKAAFLLGEPMNYAHILDRVFNKPLLIHGPALHATLHALSDRVTLELPDAEMTRYTEREQQRAGYEVVKGVGIISVIGKTVHRGGFLDSLSGVTSYEMLTGALRQALDDDEVEEIALIVDSPGGEAAGAFDFADEVFASRDIKRITSIVSDRALSAGYLIASSASEVVATRTAHTGSIGVVVAHMDQSEFNKKIGQKVTYIFAGDQKVDGNPHEPLPKDVMARIQQDVDQTNDLFVETIARNRSISADDVRAQQAGIFQGKNGIDSNLVDRISSEGAELSRLFKQATTGAGSRQNLQTTEKGLSMSNENDGGEPMLTVAESEKQVSDARLAGIKDERTRIAGILNCEEAKGRAETAKTLALDTDMGVDEAKKVLASTPEAKQESISPFESAMEDEGNPDVGLDDGDSNLTDDQKAAAFWDDLNSEQKGAK